MLASPYVLEPIRPAVFLLQEGFAFVEFAGSAALAFRRVRAIKEGNMPVAYVFEPATIVSTFASSSSFNTNGRISIDLPVDFGLILEQAQGDTMNRRVTPPFVVEPASSI